MRLHTIHFREFLLEMETTLQEKDMIREIIRHLIAGDKRWFDEYGILYGDKGLYWILNYRQGPRNEFNRLVRGMVVQKPTAGFNGDPLSLIRSFPFIRFYNHGESESSPIDFSNAEMLEKMDGTMVGVFFPHQKAEQPEFHTRKMMSTHADDVGRTLTTFDGKQAKFLPVIRGFVDNLKFSAQDVPYTYVFEFIHEISYVLTKYRPHQYGLYLLGARNVITHKELTEDQLDETAKRIGAARPRRFDTVADHSEITKMFALAAKETPDFEGYVFRDKTTGNRVKVKDPDYVEKHHLLDDLSFKRLIPLILKGEEDEVVAYFPHAKERIAEFHKAYDNYAQKAYDIVRKWQATGLTGRALAVDLFGENPMPKWQLRLNKMQGNNTQKPEPKEKDEFIRDMILKYNSVKDEDMLRQKIDEELRGVALGLGTNLGNPKKLIDMIDLHDTEEEGQDVGEI